MHRLKELIRDLFDVEMDSLHNIEIQDIDFAPIARKEIDKTVGEMSSLVELSIDIPGGRELSLENAVQCQGFWVESTKDLVLYLWDGYQSKMILLGSNNWAVRNDITIH
ncbi:MAG: hypothetical protein K9N21_09660 [Deltaproteobacteria bacterium]|nr:hypothetical protein [Deltaproteobacteria bacterium]